MDICSFCGKGEREHDLLRHEFTTTNQLVPKQVNPRNVQLAGSTIDVPLRLLLMEKGIITHTELLEVEGRVAATIRKVKRG